MSGVDIPVPTAYAQFTIERAFWETLGWSANDLYHKRPRKQVQDYLKIFKVIDAHRKEEMARANKPRQER
jgi:hypothetical protein